MKERPLGSPGFRRRSPDSHAKSVRLTERGQESQRLLQRAAEQRESQLFSFRLFITGTTPASARAVEQVRSACEKYLPGRYELDVIDIFQKPSLARDEQIIATPTLLRLRPMPTRRYIGDFSNIPKLFDNLAPERS